MKLLGKVVASLLFTVLLGTVLKITWEAFLMGWNFWATISKAWN